MSSDPQKIYSGTLAAKCEPVDIVMVDMFSDTQNGDVSEDTGPSQKCETIINKHYTPIYDSLASVSDEHASIPNHLKDLFESSKTLLSEAEAEALSSLLVKHTDAFSKYKGDVGRCNLIGHRINTAKNRPPPPPDKASTTKTATLKTWSR